MPILITPPGGKTFKLIPAPLVTISKAAQFAQDGRPISTNHTITLDGTMLPNRGSPQSNGWWTSAGDPPDEHFTSDGDRHNSLLRKQELLRSIFGTPGIKVNYSAPSQPPIEFYPKMIGIDFKADTWVVRSDYSIKLEAALYNLDQSSQMLDDNFGTAVSGKFLSSVSDSYQINERDDGTRILELNRTVSATAFTAYTPDGSGNIIGAEAWINAKAWVTDRLNTVPMVTGDSRFVIPTTGTYYNTITQETIDKYAGSYSVNQRYLYHRNNYYEIRQVQINDSKNLIGDFAPDTRRITVNGTIYGLDASNDAVNKLTNARTYYNLIATGLGTIVGAVGSALTKNVTEDNAAGSLAYSYEFINTTGNTYKHHYDVNFTLGTSESPTVTIAGNIEGITSDTTYPDVSGITKFARAASGWDLVKNSLRSLAFAETTIFGTSGYSSYFGNKPINKSIGFNKVDGIINYNYIFGYGGSGGIGLNYQEDYNIELSTANAYDATAAGNGVTATINGQIRGLATDDLPDTKYANAKVGWSTIKGNLYSRVNTEASQIGSLAPLVNQFVARSYTASPQAGSISYSATFNNARPASADGVAIEDITVEDVNSNDVFAVQVIPGRAAGPIIQNIGTRNERRRNINVSLIMFPASLLGGGNYWTYSDKATVDALASGAIVSAGAFPAGNRGTSWFVGSDSTNWDFKNGVYTRSISIVY